MLYLRTNLRFGDDDPLQLEFRSDSLAKAARMLDAAATEIREVVAIIMQLAADNPAD